MNKTHLIAAAAAILLPATAVLAANPADTIKARQENFKAMGKAMKAIGDELKSPTPNLAVISAGAKDLNSAAVNVGKFFPKGTGVESGQKTDALPAIWAKPADFNAANGKLVGASKALLAASASGNIDQVKASVGGVGGSCKGCHDNFRKPRS